MNGPVLTPQQQRAGQQPAQNSQQPSWFDADGNSTSPQNSSATPSQGSWFDANDPGSMVTMISPNGSSVSVDSNRIQEMRRNNYALSPDTPGAMKAVDYNNGKVNYILPSEQDSFHNAGHAIVQPDGSIRYPIIRDSNGVIAQDSLAEQQAHQKVYDALNADEAARNKSYELRDAGKAMLKSTVATGLGVLGAGGLAAAAEPSIVPVAGGVGFGGAGATETLGPSLLGRAAVPAGQFLLKHAMGAGMTAGGIGALYTILKKARMVP